MNCTKPNVQNVERCSKTKCMPEVCNKKKYNFSLQTPVEDIKYVSLDDLKDTQIFNPNDGDYLCFTGGNWIPSPIGSATGGGILLDDLVDVNVKSSSMGDYLFYNGSDIRHHPVF